MSGIKNIDRWYMDSEGEEHLLTVSYIYHEAKKAPREEGSGLPLEPEELSFIEIVRIATETGDSPEFSIPGYVSSTAERVYSWQILQEIEE